MTILVCIFCPAIEAELRYCQGWSVHAIGHHGAWSVLACRAIEAVE